MLLIVTVPFLLPRNGQAGMVLSGTSWPKDSPRLIRGSIMTGMYGVESVKEIFQSSRWPKEDPEGKPINWEGEFERQCQKVQDMLRPQKIPYHLFKTRALKHAAENIGNGGAFDTPPAIYFGERGIYREDPYDQLADYSQSLKLGEKVAIGILQGQKNTLKESFTWFFSHQA